MGARPGFQNRGGMANRSFRGRAFGSFSPYEHQRWAGGHWHNEWHAGRMGWWWEVDGAWYLYNDPIYPFPDYVADFVDEPAATAADQSGQLWYFCDASQTFFPYVNACPGGWRAMPAGAAP
jgi:hypothetical protein